MSERLAQVHKHHLRASRCWDFALFLRRLNLPVIPQLMIRYIRSRYGADLPLWHRRPRELYLMHNALGTVIHPDTKFTGPAIVFHQVTLGNLWTIGPREGAPTIGAHVFIGAGAKVMGRTTVGDCVIIGANCVVTHDVPSCSVVTMKGTRKIDPETVRRVYFGCPEIQED